MSEVRRVPMPAIRTEITKTVGSYAVWCVECGNLKCRKRYGGRLKGFTMIPSPVYCPRCGTPCMSPLQGATNG